MESPSAKHVFCTQLNALFSSSKVGLTNLDVAREVRRRGCPLSTPYLSQLRTGVRTNPSNLVVDALADYFNVSPDFFFDPHGSDPASSTGTHESEVLGKLASPGLRRLLSACVGLSDLSMELLVEISDHLRRPPQ
jgi:transcriptional regulator with XRE-family HTH domain